MIAPPKILLQPDIQPHDLATGPFSSLLDIRLRPITFAGCLQTVMRLQGHKHPAAICRPTLLPQSQ